MANVNKITRFLRKATTHGLDPEKCWTWNGAGKGNGYGHTSKGPAHRRSYELMVGKIPDGFDVCHKCDVRCCVNPDHLFIGTRALNMHDMKLKGRGDGGNRKHLKEHHVQEIRRRLWAGVPPREIAESMAIATSTVYDIESGKTYVSK